MTGRVEIRTTNKYSKTAAELGDSLAKIRLTESEKTRPTPSTSGNVHEIDDDSDEGEDCRDDGETNGEPNGDLLSVPPSDYDEANRLYHIQFVQRSALKVRQEPEKKFKNGTRMSMHFSNDRMREIDRCNKILLKKILNSGPSHMPSSAARTAKSTTSSAASSRVTSATINRRRQQQRIDHDNDVLLKKLQNIHRNK